MRFRLASAAAALVLTTACSVDEKVARPAARELELYASVTALSLLQDDSRPIGAIVRDRSSGQREAGAQITYASDDAAVAHVSPVGEVLAISPGTATITLTAHDPYRQQQLTQQIPVTVLPNPAVAVEFRPSSLQLFVDDTLTLATWVLNEDGLDLFRRPRTFWVVEADAAVASVSEFGRVTIKQAGTARVVVEAEGFRDTATIEVPGPAPVAAVALAPSPVTLAVGETQALTVTLTSWQGRELTGRTVTFESSNPLVATVDASGVITAVAAGSATVTATSEGKRASVTVTIGAAP